MVQNIGLLAYALDRFPFIISFWIVRIGGALMIGDAVLTETPVDTLTRIWRDDPSLNQYQYRPAISVTKDGAFLSLSGTL